MTRLAVLAIPVLCAMPVTAVAQTPAAAVPPAVTPAPPARGTAPPGPAAKPQTPVNPVDAAAAVLQAPGFTYNAEGRRDPFISLLRRGTVTQGTRTDRVAGLAGLGIDEVTPKGMLASQGGFVAMLQGADGKTYIVRTGEQLHDGSIRAITQDAVVFVQRVDDPLSRDKQREVRKVLRQTEEAK